MATIILQPDSLSFSKNLKKFDIATSSEITFKLSQGGSLIIDESYSPNALGRVVIDIESVIKNSLSLAIPTSSIFSQPAAVKEFTAEIDFSITVGFAVIFGGVENLADTVNNFVTSNWLTWQPQTKRVSYSQPEWLTYYATVAAVVKVKYYLKDKTSVVKTLHSPSASSCYTYNMQFAHIMSLQAGEKLGYYDVWVENTSGIRLTYIQRYVYKEIEIQDEIFVYQNSVGGIDTACMGGESNFTPEFEHTEGNYDDVAVQIDNFYKKIYNKSTGWLAKCDADWIIDFYNSTVRWKLVSGVLRKITLKESTISDSSNEDMKNFSFSYKFSEDKGLLNLPRTMEVPPANLEISTPEDLFFLAPRLVDFPTAELLPELLFPVQSPYSETWKKISYQQLISEIDKSIGEGVVRMEIDSSLGWMIGKDETTTISIRVYKRWVDITSQMITWQWLRNSGDAPSDEIWNLNHSSLANIADISFEDLGNTLESNVSCKFIIKAHYDEITISTTIEI